MTKQELATRIWATANELRKNIKASEYKDYILGFMFYKYLCDKELDYLKGLGGDIEDLKEADAEVKEKFKDEIGYFIQHENLFHVWKDAGINLGAKDVSEALDDFYLNLNEKYKRVFDNIFSALQSGLGKLGENAGSRDKAVRDIVDLIDMIPPTSRDYDVLGYIYEYLIQQFSSEAKKDGAFYTPSGITRLMSCALASRLKDRERVTVYDPTVGSGGLLLHIGNEVGRYVDPDKITYFGQELISETANLAKMNLFMQGVPIQNINMRNANTLEADWPYFDEQTPYEPLFVDAVVSNPPYSAHYEPEKHQTDERFKGYGLAPSGKADYAFLLHCLYHIKNDGIMAIVMPHGVLFRGDSEGEIRKNLILNHNIETIIGCPANCFFSTNIPVVIMTLSKNRAKDDVLFIDASQSYKKDKKQNVLTESDIKRILDAVTERKDIPNFAHLASIEEIEANGYNLNIPRYVSAATDEAPYDLFSVMSGKVSEEELDRFEDIWNQFPLLRKKLVNMTGEYSTFADVDCRQTVFADEDVKKFLDRMCSTSEDFRKYLVSSLINKEVTPAVHTNIENEVFGMYKEMPLLDVYRVYQALEDNWGSVDTDLARLANEGWQICIETEPNMVTKKDSKTKKMVEEQKGWKGKIIPFDMVKTTFFAEDFAKMSELLAQADSYAAEYADIWECMDEDSRALLCKDDDETAMDTSKLKTVLKAGLLDDGAASCVREIQDKIAKEKELRKTVKKIAAELEDKAKDKVEHLTENEINDLLEKKWVLPIVKAINGVGENVITKFAADFEALKKKYADPLSELSDQIEQTSASLKDSLSHLTGGSADMDAIKMLLAEL